MTPRNNSRHKWFSDWPVQPGPQLTEFKGADHKDEEIGRLCDAYKRAGFRDFLKWGGSKPGVPTDLFDLLDPPIPRLLREYHNAFKNLSKALWRLDAHKEYGCFVFDHFDEEWTAMYERHAVYEALLARGPRGAPHRFIKRNPKFPPHTTREPKEMSNWHPRHKQRAETLYRWTLSWEEEVTQMPLRQRSLPPTLPSVGEAVARFLGCSVAEVPTLQKPWDRHPDSPEFWDDPHFNMHDQALFWSDIGTFRHVISGVPISDQHDLKFKNDRFMHVTVFVNTGGEWTPLSEDELAAHRREYEKRVPIWPNLICEWQVYP